MNTLLLTQQLQQNTINNNNAISWLFSTLSIACSGNAFLHEQNSSSISREFELTQNNKIKSFNCFKAILNFKEFVKVYMPQYLFKFMKNKYRRGSYLRE